MSDFLWTVDWTTFFVPKVSVLEIFLRGSAMYLALFLLLRLVLKRQAGNVGVTDLLVVVLIADAAQNAMSADYRSVPEGLVLVGTLIFWSYALDWLGCRIGWLRLLVHPPALVLVRDGRMLRKNMAKELITAEELLSQIRKHGVDEVGKVRSAVLEGDGHISVVPYEPQANGNDEQKAL
jgi:uncharacterized membrane protein YcaP (DUF421 family)